MEIKDETREDIIKAYLYYEKEQTGLGERFLTHLDDYLDRIGNNPDHYPKNARHIGKRLCKYSPI